MCLSVTRRSFGDVSFCLSVCLPVCLSVCLPVGLFSVSLSAWRIHLPAYPFVLSPTRLSVVLQGFDGEDHHGLAPRHVGSDPG